MASDLLQENSTRNAKNFPGFAPNRFAQLRDSSPLSARSRSPSTKRKQFEGPSSYANAAKKRHTVPAPPKKSSSLKPPDRAITISSENMEILEINSARVSSLCEKLHSAILAIPEENPICPILRDFCEIIHAHNSSHNIIAAALRSSLPLPSHLSQQEPTRAPTSNLFPLALSQSSANCSHLYANPNLTGFPPNPSKTLCASLLPQFCGKIPLLSSLRKFSVSGKV